MDSHVIYVGSQFIFGIMFLILLYLRHATNREQRFDKLDVLYCLFIVTAVLDSIWMLINGRVEYRNWHIALQVVYLCTMSLTGYTWFLYTLDLFPAKSAAIRKYRFIIGIPVLITMVLIVVSIWTSWMFVVEPDGTYTRGDMHIYMIIMNYIYMLMGSIVALRCRSEALLAMDKRRFGAAALFPVPALILSAAQLILPPGLPAMQGGVLIAFLLLYGTSQNVMITRDHLTELPNRFAFEQELLERIHLHRSTNSKRLFLMEGDLNKFKHINDAFGHPAGDAVLVQTARVLDDIFSKYGMPVFRTGGDEFMMIAEQENDIDVDALREEVNEKLCTIETPDKEGISMSIGVQEYTSPMDSRAFIESVDENLYAIKNAIKN